MTTTENAPDVASTERPGWQPAGRPEGVLPGGREWVISAAGHRACVVEVGGGLRSYSVDGVELLDGYPPEELPQGCRGQILAPWANRIRDGEYSFADEDHQLPIGEIPTHTAFHGMVRWQAWEPEVVEDDSIVLTTVIRASDGYPFTVSLAVRYEVGRDGLTVSHTATNIGRSAAPFMLATHCYPRISGHRVDELRLTVPAATYLPTDDRNLPLPAQSVQGTRFDFADGPLFGDRVVDNAFGDLRRDADGLVRVTITAPDGHGVQMWSGEAFDWLQVYSSDTQTGERFRRSFAVEPMTGPPDNFRSGADLVVLDPGQRWAGRWGLRPVPPTSPGSGAAGDSRGSGAAGDSRGSGAAGDSRGSGAAGDSRGGGAAESRGGTLMGPPVTGTARDLLPEVTVDEAEIRRVDPSLADYAAGDDDERILREIPPHSAG